MSAHQNDTKAARDLRLEIIDYLDSYKLRRSGLEKGLFSKDRQGPKGRVRPKARPGSGGHTQEPR